MSTSTAIERYEGIPEHQWAAWEKQAAQLVKSPLAGAFQAKNDNERQAKTDQILLVAVTMNALDMELNPQTLAQFWVADGKVNMSAQLMISLAARNRHELWFPESDDDHCIAAIIRWGSSREQQFTYTIQMARRAGLCDRWVERKVTHEGERYPRTERFIVGDDRGIYDQDARATLGLPAIPEWAQKKLDGGYVKYKDNWQKFPELMLQARAATRAIKAACPDVLMGLRSLDVVHIPDDEDPPAPVQVIADQPEPDDQDDDVVDAELVDDDKDSPAEGGGETADAAFVEAPDGAADQTGKAATAAPDSPPQQGSGQEKATGDSGATSPKDNAVADPPTAPAPKLADDWDREATRNRIAGLPPDLQASLTSTWRAEKWGSAAEGAQNPLTKDDLPKVEDAIRKLEAEAKPQWDHRRKHANAVMGEIGVKKDSDRHAFVKDATNGETDSTGRLSQDQLDRVIALVEERKAEAAAEAAEEQARAAAESDANQSAEAEEQANYAPGEEPF